MSDPFPFLNLETAELLDKLCDQFEGQLRGGNRPSIEAYLSKIDAAQQPALLYELLRIELEVPGQPHEIRDVGVYRVRFAKFSETVDEVFADHMPAGPSENHALRRVGRFEILGKLGSGAFGTVYRAHDPQLDRSVAIKMPRQGVLSGARERQRFLLEARAAATLRHPNVCPIFEVGEQDGRPYIVMAYIAGQSLAAILKLSARWDEVRAVRLVRELAVGLAAAHTQGIVHRDLKPGNVLLDEQGVPVLTDFGLAVDLRRTAADGRLGPFLGGTPAYMAPEQVSDPASVSPAVDIYSLGVILYELLSGQRAFNGSVSEVLTQISQGSPPAIRELRPDLDARLEDICRTAMARQPADRFASMRDVVAAMDRYLESANSRGFNATSVDTVVCDATQPIVPLQPLPAARGQRPRHMWRRGVAALLITLSLWLSWTMANWGIARLSQTNQPTASNNAKSIVVDPDRDVAEWLLFIGASFRIDVAGELRLVSRRGDLPEGPFRIIIIDLSRQHQLQNADLARLQNLHSLGALDCFDTPIGDEGLVYLAPLKQLDNLSLSRTEVTDSGLQHLAGLEKLQSLTLNQTNVRGDGLRYLQALPALKRLSLAGNALGTEAFEQLVRLESLEQLVLDKTPTNDAALAICGRMHGLTVLELCNTPISDAGLRHLIGLPRLKRLRLDWCRISNNGVNAIAAMEQLEAITLNQTQVDGKGMVQLASLKNLRCLSLNNVKVGRNFLAELADWSALEDLSLWGATLNDEHVAALSQLTQLKRLNLGRTRLTTEGLNRLQQALPNCELLR